MKKLITSIVLLMLVSLGFTYAYYGSGNGMVLRDNSALHQDDVENILETGTYDDLVKLRENIGYNVMPRVNSEEDFNQMKERHEYMEENGFALGHGRFAGNRFNSNCPMSN